MSDDTSNRGPQDRSRVEMDDDYEVSYWTERFGVTREELRTKAVACLSLSLPIT